MNRLACIEARHGLRLMYACVSIFYDGHLFEFRSYGSELSDEDWIRV